MILQWRGPLLQDGEKERVQLNAQDKVCVCVCVCIVCIVLFLYNFFNLSLFHGAIWSLHLHRHTLSYNYLSTRHLFTTRIIFVATVACWASSLFVSFNMTSGNHNNLNHPLLSSPAEGEQCPSLRLSLRTPEVCGAPGGSGRRALPGEPWQTYPLWSGCAAGPPWCRYLPGITDGFCK